MSNPLPWELLSIVEGFHNYSLPALDFFDPRRSFGPLRVWSRSASRPAGLAAELSMISLGAAVHSVTSQSRTAPIVTPVASVPLMAERSSAATEAEASEAAEIPRPASYRHPTPTTLYWQTVCSLARTDARLFHSSSSFSTSPAPAYYSTSSGVSVNPFVRWHQRVALEETLPAGRAVPLQEDGDERRRRNDPHGGASSVASHVAAMDEDGWERAAFADRQDRGPNLPGYMRELSFEGLNRVAPDPNLPFESISTLTKPTARTPTARAGNALSRHAVFHQLKSRQLPNRASRPLVKSTQSIVKAKSSAVHIKPANPFVVFRRSSMLTETSPSPATPAVVADPFVAHRRNPEASETVNALSTPPSASSVVAINPFASLRRRQEASKVLSAPAPPQTSDLDAAAEANQAMTNPTTTISIIGDTHANTREDRRRLAANAKPASRTVSRTKTAPSLKVTSALAPSAAVAMANSTSAPPPAETVWTPVNPFASMKRKAIVKDRTAPELNAIEPESASPKILETPPVPRIEITVMDTAPALEAPVVVATVPLTDFASKAMASTEKPAAVAAATANFIISPAPAAEGAVALNIPSETRANADLFSLEESDPCPAPKPVASDARSHSVPEVNPFLRVARTKKVANAPRAHMHEDAQLVAFGNAPSTFLSSFSASAAPSDSTECVALADAVRSFDFETARDLLVELHSMSAPIVEDRVYVLAAHAALSDAAAHPTVAEKLEWFIQWFSLVPAWTGRPGGYHTKAFDAFRRQLIELLLQDPHEISRIARIAVLVAEKGYAIAFSHHFVRHLVRFGPPERAQHYVASICAAAGWTDKKHASRQAWLLNIAISKLYATGRPDHAIALVTHARQTVPPFYQHGKLRPVVSFGNYKRIFQHAQEHWSGTSSPQEGSSPAAWAASDWPGRRLVARRPMAPFSLKLSQPPLPRELPATLRALLRPGYRIHARSLSFALQTLYTISPSRPALLALIHRCVLSRAVDGGCIRKTKFPPGEVTWLNAELYRLLRSNRLEGALDLFVSLHFWLGLPTGPRWERWSLAVPRLPDRTRSPPCSSTLEIVTRVIVKLSGGCHPNGAPFNGEDLRLSNLEEDFESFVRGLPRSRLDSQPSCTDLPLSSNALIAHNLSHTSPWSADDGGDVFSLPPTFKVNHQVWRSWVIALSRSSSDAVLRVLAEMQARDIPLSCAEWKRILASFGRRGEWDRVLAGVDTLEREGGVVVQLDADSIAKLSSGDRPSDSFPPIDSGIYTYLIAIATQFQQHQVAAHLEAKMRASGVQPRDMDKAVLRNVYLRRAICPAWKEQMPGQSEGDALVSPWGEPAPSHPDDLERPLSLPADPNIFWAFDEGQHGGWDQAELNRGIPADTLRRRREARWKKAQAVMQIPTDPMAVVAEQEEQHRLKCEHYPAKPETGMVMSARAHEDRISRASRQ